MNLIKTIILLMIANIIMLIVKIKMLKAKLNNLRIKIIATLKALEIWFIRYFEIDEATMKKIVRWIKILYEVCILAFFCYIFF